MTWLRHNLAALIVIAVSVPALAVVLVVIPLSEDQDADIVTVQQGDTVEVYGHSITLTATQEFVGTGTGPDDNDIPLGTSIVAALFDVEPAGEPLAGSCEAKLTSRAGGTERAWPTIASPREFHYEVGEGRSTLCLFDGEAFELETVFLSPVGTYEHATLDLVVPGTTYRFVPDLKQE